MIDVGSFDWIVDCTDVHAAQVKNQSIADEYGCTEGHAKDVGSLLWQLLSKLLNNKVTKNNFRTIILQYFTAKKLLYQPSNFLEQQESSQFLDRQSSLRDLHDSRLTW